MWAMIAAMTFSIVARCPDTGQVGVGAVTAMLAVGKFVTHARPQAGAIATQAFLNPYLGIDGVALLERGATAQEALDDVLSQDPDAKARQVGVVDRQGRAAAWTGEVCTHWAGHRTGESFTAQGNRLVGPQTVEAVADAFLDHPDLGLAERLLVALEAGEATGADTKGAQSATIYVMDTEEYPIWDIRIDHADDPVAELRRLAGLFTEKLLPHVRQMPTRANPEGRLGHDPEHSIA